MPSLSTSKGDNEHDSINRILRIHVLGSSMPHILIEHHSIASFQYPSIETRFTITTNNKGWSWLMIVRVDTAQTNLFHVFVGAMMRASAHGGSTHTTCGVYSLRIWHGTMVRQ